MHLLKVRLERSRVRLERSCVAMVFLFLLVVATSYTASSRLGLLSTMLIIWWLESSACEGFYAHPVGGREGQL